MVSPATGSPGDQRDQVLILTLRSSLLAALNYVLSLSLIWAVNVKPVFPLLYLSAGIWGWPTSVLTAALSFGLWTMLNPFGPAPLPVALAQVIAGMVSAIICVIMFNLGRRLPRIAATVLAAITGLLSTATFFLLITSVDAWLNQPFWPWFLTGMAFSLLPIAVNTFLFPLLPPIITRLRRLRAEQG